ncbi:MAG: hypothetical protein HOE80_03025 [Candidatus Magasanikbacteria bacterium]|nr:hypothetical protein [Candidatus Magasanikbacteria bacterium]MBT4071672.1 hypothetical protein [Candidatus Magasanikbacteria bacterium]
MTLRQYLTIMIVATLLCWTAWGVVLLNVDPFYDTGMGFLFFYISLFFSLIGTSSILIFGLSVVFSKKELPIFRHVRRTFIIGVVLATTLIGLLFLQGKQLLTLWNMLLLFSIICFFILFRISTKSQHRNV